MLGANPLQDETVAPTDLLVNQAGWKNTDFNLTSWHPIRSDILDARLPRWIHAKDTLRNGKLPLWNSSPINGTPGMQWLPAATITPAFFIFAMIEDNATGYYFGMLANLLIAAIGCYLLLMTLTGHRLAALFGAILFSYSGFHAAWFFWAHVSTSIWIPWVLLFSYQYLNTQKLRYLPWLSLAMAFMLFGGFPSIVVYTLIAILVMGLIYAPWQDGLSRVALNAGNIAFYLILGFLIPVFAIYSLHEMLQFTQTFSWRNGGTPLNITHLAKFIDPIGNRYGDVERTFYVGLIPLVLLIFTVPFLFFKIFSKHLAFSLTLIVISVVIAFGILPADLIRKIPTFSTNNWGRILMLIPLGFAILSAEILAKLFASKLVTRFHPALPIAVGMLLISLQFTDLHRVFREFNGPVPAETFFPPTPSISHIQSNIDPLQSAMIDHGFLISGVLASYHIPEWFAHGFRTPKETKVFNQRVAINSFRTPTSAIIYCPDIDFQSNLLDLLGVRYILCTDALINNKMPTTLARTSGKKSTPSTLITPESAITQYFKTGQPISLDIISIRMATYSRPTAHADLTLSVYTNDQLLAQSTVPAKQIGDNVWVNFQFTDGLKLTKGEHKIVLEAKPVEPDGRLSAWLYPSKDEHFYIEQGGTRHKSILAAKFHKIQNLSDIHLKSHEIEPGINLLENTHITGSGYFLSKLSEEEIPNFDTVKLEHHSETRYELEYTGSIPGWLILPLRFYPGWQAYKNNQLTQTKAFLGMLPAIAVQPGDHVSYHYKPRMLVITATISLFALVIVIYLTYRLRKR
jgi:hypothetical protein